MLFGLVSSVNFTRDPRHWGCSSQALGRGSALLNLEDFYPRFGVGSGEARGSCYNTLPIRGRGGTLRAREHKEAYLAAGGGLALLVGEWANRWSARQKRKVPELSSLKHCTCVEDSTDGLNRTP